MFALFWEGLPGLNTACPKRWLRRVRLRRLLQHYWTLQLGGETALRRRDNPAASSIRREARQAWLPDRLIVLTRGPGCCDPRRAVRPHPPSGRGPRRALGYIERIEAYCAGCGLFPERRTRRDRHEPRIGRTIGFEEPRSIGGRRGCRRSRSRNRSTADVMSFSPREERREPSIVPVPFLAAIR